MNINPNNDSMYSACRMPLAAAYYVPHAAQHRTCSFARPQVDTLAGASKILSKFHGDDENRKWWSDASQEFDTLSHILPALLASCACQHTLDKVTAKRAERGLQLPVQFDEEFIAEANFLLAFNAAAKEHTSLKNNAAAPAGVGKFVTRVEKFIAFMEGRIDALLSESIKDVEETGLSIKGKLVDLKPILKSFDTSMDQLINLPNRTELISQLKSLNGGQAGGLKRFDKLVFALAGTALGAQRQAELERIKARAVETRQAARVLVACRTATVILSKKKAGDVSAFMHEIKALRVMLPKEIKVRLDALVAANR
jgi:hypothetical protein